MSKELQENYEIVDKTLKEVETYYHAINVLSFDLETICPSKGMEDQGDLITFLDDKAFRLLKDSSYIKAAEYLYNHINELDNEYKKRLALHLHRDYNATKNITPLLNEEFSVVLNKSYRNWIEAKQKNDFSLFAQSLEDVKNIELKRVSLLDEKVDDIYDNLLNRYEYGITSKDLDKFFAKVKEKLVPLLKQITLSSKKIRTDFLYRTVTDEQQQKIAKYLLEVIGFDFTKGAFTTTEHPFTNQLGKNDTRVTTHYYPNLFISNMYSIIHEGGHALFEMFQPSVNYDFHINGNKTMGMHESTSRFYENIIGRSKEFIHLIFPKCQEILKDVLDDVTEKEFYEAINLVTPSLIRTEADEFTYTFHIMIRYEIEKMIVSNEIDINDVPQVWKDKYQEYLGIVPSNDSEGVLQDVHWASGFGYFPTYALGNFYNAMYFNKMKKDIDVTNYIREGKFDLINKWMIDNVWAKADILDPKDWIKDITGRDATVDDFIEYLEIKYKDLYEL